VRLAFPHYAYLSSCRYFSRPGLKEKIAQEMSPYVQKFICQEHNHEPYSKKRERTGHHTPEKSSSRPRIEAEEKNTPATTQRAAHSIPGEEETTWEFESGKHGPSYKNTAVPAIVANPCSDVSFSFSDHETAASRSQPGAPSTVRNLTYAECARVVDVDWGESSSNGSRS